MQLAIMEPDREAGELLAFAASRRGHRAVHVGDVDRLFGHLPFPPNVAVVSADEAPLATVTTRLRERYPDVIVMLTTEDGSAIASVEAFKTGAQDIIRKPYYPHEVILRAESRLAARGRPTCREGVVEIADLKVDLTGYIATKNGTPLNLTWLELRLLYCLGRHHPNLTPLERLLSFGWREDGDPDPSLLKTHISHLRTKLHDAGGVPFEIRARRSMGYVLELAAPGEPEQLASVSA